MKARAKQPVRRNFPQERARESPRNRRFSLAESGPGRVILAARQDACKTLKVKDKKLHLYGTRGWFGAPESAI
jgi:hypothetical protein